jgi:hypothetical protein
MPYPWLIKRARYGVAVALLAGAALAPAFSAEDARKAIPDFAPDTKTGWQLSDDDFLQPAEGGPGPVVSDPRYPYISFYRYQANPRPSFRVADLNNIILQPTNVRCPVGSSRSRKSAAYPSACRPSYSTRRLRSTSCRRRRKS